MYRIYLSVYCHSLLQTLSECGSVPPLRLIGLAYYGLDFDLTWLIVLELHKNRLSFEVIMTSILLFQLFLGKQLCPKGHNSVQRATIMLRQTVTQATAIFLSSSMQNFRLRSRFVSLCRWSWQINGWNILDCSSGSTLGLEVISRCVWFSKRRFYLGSLGVYPCFQLRVPNQSVGLLT